jgi:hypothetical protein
VINSAIAAARIHRGLWRDVDFDIRTGCYGNETCLFVPPNGSASRRLPVS